MHKGDRVSTSTRRIGQQPRRGVVQAVQGHLVTVRWDDGNTTTMVPSSGSLNVEARPRAKPTGRR